MNRNINAALKLSIYILCFYTLYLYVSELIINLRVGVELPLLKSASGFDTFLLLAGGLMLGGILIKIGGKANKGFGAFIILVNILVGGFLLLDAMV